ncbi:MULTISPECIES: hypothetical protein [unclassified Spirillospora]|uniref:hypothetical protein n=1 Tax=unclassified Spirillospora TaxID=2642701 RepID=UPI003712ECBD
MTGDRPAAVPQAPGSAPPPTASPAPGPPDNGLPDTGPPAPGSPGAGPADLGTVDTGPSDPSSPGSAACGSGTAEVRALIRTQLRIALGTCAIVVSTVTGLPVLLATVPAIARARVHGVPLWWLVLALGVQPLWIAVSRCQLRRAERAERDLTRPVGRP